MSILMTLLFFSHFSLAGPQVPTTTVAKAPIKNQAVAAKAPAAPWPDAVRLAQVKKMGIDINKDKISQKPNLVRFFARKNIVYGDYRCPMYSRVDVAKFMTYIIPHGIKDCYGKKNKMVQGVKISRSGVASPL